jgi:hypothetical protein
MIVTTLEFIALALGATRLTRFVTTDTMFSSLREKIWRRYSPEKLNIGYLITCNWCTSVYTATLVLIMYRITPEPTLFVSCILAYSLIAGAILDRVD